jgi:Zn-dependent protease with chaperone function
MLQADYYDGRTTRRSPVQLQLAAGMLRVSGAGVERHEELAQLRISERLGSAPRLIRFADGAFCEVRDFAQLEALLLQARVGDGQVDRWQRGWSVPLLSLILLAAICFSAYRWGLPWSAAWFAQRTPESVVQAISRQALASLDQGVLKPSALPAGRQQQLREGLEALRAPQGAALPPHQLLFRSSPAIGPNAISLPDGSIILFDELVKLADNDQQIYGVLGHELGHVHHRHGLRMLLQATVLGSFTAWWFGDFSSLLVVAPTLLLQARYSQAFETEADAYAVSLMRDNHIEPLRLAEILEKLTAVHGDKKDEHFKWQDYLSSHPATDARIQALSKG